jgi:AmmeMemoRadiSam system protein B
MESPKARKASFAGKFYPADKNQLKKEIGGLVDKTAKKGTAIGCVLPHAGYIYSGKVAAQTLSGIKIPDKLIILGPNHTGYGKPLSLMAKGSWQTPLGNINIDSKLAKALLDSCKYLEEDFQAHLWEHSIEVELPFLQYFKDSFEIVPITCTESRIDILKQTGQEIAAGLKGSGQENSVMIIASSDMTHYQSQQIAEKKDREAIKAILDLDEDKLLQKVKSMDISMCGYAPVILMLAATKALGAKTAKLIKYQTSGDITDDRNEVVGYAGITISL